MKFFRQITQAIKHALAAPGRFIDTCDALATAVQEQTQAVQEQTNTIAAQHKELIAALAPVETHTRYLAHSEKHKLQRAGHRHDF